MLKNVPNIAPSYLSLASISLQNVDWLLYCDVIHQSFSLKISAEFLAEPLPLGQCSCLLGEFPGQRPGTFVILLSQLNTFKAI